jgi:hypothetical protein
LRRGPTLAGCVLQQARALGNSGAICLSVLSPIPHLFPDQTPEPDAAPGNCPTLARAIRGQQERWADLSRSRLVPRLSSPCTVWMAWALLDG